MSTDGPMLYFARIRGGDGWVGVLSHADPHILVRTLAYTYVREVLALWARPRV